MVKINNADRYYIDMCCLCSDSDDSEKRWSLCFRFILFAELKHLRNVINIKNVKKMKLKVKILIF